MAGFSVACLLTLTLLPPPLSLARRISACFFSVAIPLLVASRLAWVLWDDEPPEPTVLNFSQRLRLFGYVSAIIGFSSLLAELYWLASLLFVAGVVALAISVLRNKFRAEHEKASQDTSGPASDSHVDGPSGTGDSSANAHPNELK